MKRALALAVALTAAATPALSLSCLRPDVVRMYEEIRDAEASYWLLKGRITPLESVIYPKKDAQGQYVGGKPALTKVRFNGLGLGLDGSYRPVVQDITMAIECASVWCGEPPLNQEIFAAVELTEAGPVLTIGPCPWHALSVTDEAEERLLSCVRDDDCRYNQP